MLRAALAIALAAFTFAPAPAQAHPHDHRCAGFVDALCYHYVPRGGTMVRVECEVFFSGNGVVDTEGCWHR